MTLRPMSGGVKTRPNDRATLKPWLPCLRMFFKRLKLLRVHKSDPVLFFP